MTVKKTLSNIRICSAARYSEEIAKTYLSSKKRISGIRKKEGRDRK